MLLVAVVGLGLLLVPVTGGRLGRLAGLHLRGLPLLVAALACQVLALVVLPGPRALLLALHALSYALAGLVVLRNRAVPGLPLVALGAAGNALVLAVNGGTMPAAEQAVRRAGLTPVVDGYTNSEVLPHAHLAALGDVWASPAWLPLGNVFSPGDLAVLAGVLWLVHGTCGTVPARVLRGLARPPARPATAAPAPPPAAG